MSKILDSNSGLNDFFDYIEENRIGYHDNRELSDIPKNLVNLNVKYENSWYLGIFNGKEFVIYDDLKKLTTFLHPSYIQDWYYLNSE